MISNAKLCNHNIAKHTLVFNTNSPVFQELIMLSHRFNEQNIVGKQLTGKFCLNEKCSDRNAFLY